MKLICKSTSGLKPDELTEGRGYWEEKCIHGKVYILNNYGYKEWYGRRRFEGIIERGKECDDSDVKIWEGDS